MSRPQMFLVSGVNGSGKSTFTKNIVRKYPYLKIIDPDAIATDIEPISAGRHALLTVQQYIRRQQSFIVESTISGRVYLAYLKQAEENGFKTIIIYVALASAEMSAQRVEMRVAAGGHNVRGKDIMRRYPRSFQNIRAHIRLCDLGYVYDNSEHYKLIATYRDGVLYRRNDIPSWIGAYL